MGKPSSLLPETERKAGTGQTYEASPSVRALERREEESQNKIDRLESALRADDKRIKDLEQQTAQPIEGQPSEQQSQPTQQPIERPPVEQQQQVEIYRNPWGTYLVMPWMNTYFMLYGAYNPWVVERVLRWECGFYPRPIFRTGVFYRSPYFHGFEFWERGNYIFDRYGSNVLTGPRYGYNGPGTAIHTGPARARNFGEAKGGATVDPTGRVMPRARGSVQQPENRVFQQGLNGIRTFVPQAPRMRQPAAQYHGPQGIEIRRMPATGPQMHPQVMGQPQQNAGRVRGR